MASFLRRVKFPRVGEGLLVLVVLGVLVVAYRRNHAPTCCGSWTSLDTPIPVEPTLRLDTLANGLTYYVEQNATPSGLAELRLVVDAGSVLEDDDQRGLAHAVEHMAFRGTTHFPGTRVVHYLQSIGMRAGDDVNASTGFDETIYRLTIPTERPETIDTALAMLADWAHEVTFDSSEARREAGVVFEEWRVRSGASRRLTTAHDSVLLGGSRYAVRSPIGDTTVLRRFDVGAMRRFYRRWYRPALMAVVAVGDFDAGEVEALVRKRFGAIPGAPSDAKARTPMPFRQLPNASVAVLADPEATSTRVGLWFARPLVRPHTVRDYRASLIERLSRSILESRVTSAAEQPESPLLNAGLFFESLTRAAEVHGITGTALDGEVPEAVGALAAEVANVQRSGATSAELERAKTKLIDQTRQAEAYADFSGELADAFVYHYLEGEPFPGREAEHDLAMTLLPDISSRDVADFARGLSLDSGLTVIVTTREPQEGTPAPITGATLLAALHDAVERAGERRRDSVVVATLLDREPEPGTMLREHYVREPDAFDWLLGNNMRVIVKPTRFIEENIELRVSAPGGASLAADGEYPSAFMADQVLAATGVGPLDGTRLTHFLDESSVSLAASVGEHALQLTGSAAPRDIERLFQLVHLYFTAPRGDTALFRRYRQREGVFARDRAADPDAAFDDSVEVSLRPGDPRALSTTPVFGEAVRLEPALDFWRARMANASNFTVVLVGDFSLERVRPLVLRYLASLPAGHPEMPRRTPPPIPTRVVEHSFRRGVDPKARTSLLFAGEVDLTPESDVALHALRDVLELTIEERLRESLGGTYGVTVRLRLQPLPRATYTFDVDFNAAPERVDSLAAAAVAEVDRLCARGPTAGEAAKVKAAALRDIGGGEESNTHWAGELSFHAQLGWPLETIRTHREVIDKLTASVLRNACRNFIDPRRYVRVTMRPREVSRVLVEQVDQRR